MSLQFQRGTQVLKLQLFKLLCVVPSSEAYSEPNQTSEMDLLLKTVNSFHKKIHLRYLGPQ